MKEEEGWEVEVEEEELRVGRKRISGRRKWGEGGVRCGDGNVFNDNHARWRRRRRRKVYSRLTQ